MSELLSCIAEIRANLVIQNMLASKHSIKNAKKVIKITTKLFFKNLEAIKAP